MSKKIPIIIGFKESWIANWKKEQGNRYRLKNTDLKHIQNLNSAIKRNSFGGYYINYENRKKLLNGLKALEKASNAIQYFNNFTQNHRQGMKHTLKYYIKETEKIYNSTRQKMIKEFTNRRKHKRLLKFKEYPSKVRGWNKTIKKPIGNEPSIPLLGFGRVVNTPWTRYVRNRLVSVKPSPSPKSSPKPNINRKFGLWRGPYKNSNSNNKYYQPPKRNNLRYYPKRNVLVTNKLAYRHAAKKFNLPRNEWM